MPSKQINIKTEDGVELDAIAVTPPQPDAAWVILAHGITVDREEDGMFERLAEALLGAGLGSVRFSFRGHGRSGVPSSAMTISGEALDLKAVVDYIVTSNRRLTAVIASSFGAVSTGLMARYLERRVESIVLWNPVLDLTATFTSPTTRWGRNNFSGKNVENIQHDGTFKIDGEFEVGIVFWEELHHFKPAASLLATVTPVLIIHGDHDDYVPFEVAQAFATKRRHTTFIPVPGADHGFPDDRDEKSVVQQTVDFIKRFV
jgi:uncharacterized protein